MKIPINYDKMLDREILSLAKKSIKELNERGLNQYKVVEK